MGLTPHQVDTLIIIERVTASISVFATLSLISSFVLIKSFRTLSNTLIFYASFANLFANVAALIGGSALSKQSSPLCQFQGFLLEMFMQSDPMWSCAMAVNVYLVFFRRFDATRLKKLYWIYALICYGLPFIPAIFCLFYRTKAKGKMYGNATLWCWIDNDWAAIRIYSYYAPIWVSILTTFIIYIRVGVEIFQKRSELKVAAYGTKSGQYATGTLSTIHDNMELDPPQPPFSGLRTTEIEVSTDSWTKESLQSPATVYAKNIGSSITEKPRNTSHRDQYSVTISSAHTMSPHGLKSNGLKASTFLPRRPTSMDKIKWAYTKCALLFAISILITWVPASVNRVYGLRYPAHPSFALNVCSAIVLPLQGFWNTIIYFMTSMSICRNCIAEFKESRRRRMERKGSIVFRTEANIQHLGGRRVGGGLPGNSLGMRGLGVAREKASDSTVELSESQSIGRGSGSGSRGRCGDEDSF